MAFRPPLFKAWCQTGLRSPTLKSNRTILRKYGTSPCHFEPLPAIQNSHPNILLVKKQNDARVSAAFDAIISHLSKNYGTSTLFHEPSDTTVLPPNVYEWQKKDDTPIDLVVTLGGDGTILHASSLFRDGPVPPVLSFSLGTLGFLLPFHINSFPKALGDVFSGKATILPRMRLSCRFLDSLGTTTPSSQIMNEVTLHRGRSPHLNIVDAYVDGQHLTEAVSDGLIVSTPTGSTAYSLSSGGPIIHPSMSALLLTPICPRSLSFRPLILPASSRIRLRISEKSRAPAEVSMDGQDARVLGPGEAVEVEASPYPIPCVNRPPPLTRTHEMEGHDSWVQDINRLLHFNASFKSLAAVTEELPRD